MAAIVNTQELNGAPAGTPTTVTTIYLQTVDQAAQDANNPMIRPLSGVNYSFWKTIYLNAATTPTTQINNVKIYSDGAIGWTGVTLYVGNETPVPGYEQATGTVGTTGTEMVAGHGGITGRTSMATFTSPSPKTVTGSITNPSTGRISNLVILQTELATTAAPGVLATETLTWRYDET